MGISAKRLCLLLGFLLALGSWQGVALAGGNCAIGREQTGNLEAVGQAHL